MDHRPSKDNTSFGRSVHSASCKKCKLERRAKALKIRIHTWPLPRSAIHAQSVVFELSPHAFSTWRDITYRILCDIAQPRDLNWTIDQPPIGVILYSIPNLGRWAPKHKPSHRVTICSIKSSSNSADDEMVGIPA